MTLLEARQVYVTALQTIPGLHVYTHGGSFTLNELKEFARQSPAAVVCLLAVDVNSVMGGAVVATADWGLVLFCERSPGQPMTQDDQAIALLGPVLNILQRTGIGDAGSKPFNVEAHNQYSTPLMKTGSALWGLEWQATIDLPDTAVSLKEFETLVAQWDLYPRDNNAPLGQVIEAEDLIEPEQA